MIKSKKAYSGKHDRKLSLRDRRGVLTISNATLLFVSFLLCIAISTAVNGLNDEALHGIPYRNIGVFHMLFFIVIYYGVSRSVKRESSIDMILFSYLITADLIAAAAMYDMCTGAVTAFHDKKELSAVFFNGNHYGYFLAMAVLAGAGLCLYGSRSRVITGAVSAILNAAALVLNHSLGPMLAAAAVLVIVMAATFIREPLCRRRILIMLAAAAVILSAAVLAVPAVRGEIVTFLRDLSAVIGGSAKGSSGHNRLKIWRLTEEYIMKRPLIGYGCEGISMKLYAETAISNPHNEILTYAAYYGIPAAAIYVLAVIAAVVESIKSGSSDPKGRNVSEDSSASRKAACMAAAGYFVSSFTGVAMFYTLPFFFIFLGLSCSRRQY